MKQAHKMAKETTNKFGGDYSANFAICLKKAHKAAKQAVSHLERVCAKVITYVMQLVIILCGVFGAVSPSLANGVSQIETAQSMATNSGIADRCVTQVLDEDEAIVVKSHYQNLNKKLDYILGSDVVTAYKYKGKKIFDNNVPSGERVGLCKVFFELVLEEKLK